MQLPFVPEQLRLITPLVTFFVIENVWPFLDVATTTKPLSSAEVMSTLPGPGPMFRPVSDPRQELTLEPDTLLPV
jgi:hypothetical protein